MDPAAASTRALRNLPAVGALLASPDLEPLVATHGRPLVTEAIRRAIEDARQRILSGDHATSVTTASIAAHARDLAQPSLRRVINATGVILHTNLGRAPLAAEAKAQVLEIAEGYCSVELDLATGKRGSRHDHVRELLTSLLETEDALVVNNCAGAVLLMLAALCQGREVLVSRGELVEIGGGFRVPDVMRASGTELVEVGTTNKVYAHDYAGAMTDRTAAILSVHRSNFEIVGFVHQPKLEELVEIGKDHQIPVLVDVGSGLVVDAETLGPAASIVEREPRPKQLLARGADVVAFSGDKLLGGPQAGLLAGKKEAIDRIRKHPLARALRADKLTLAALEATLRMVRDGRAGEIPTIAALAASADQLRARAEGLVSAAARVWPELQIEAVEDESVVGGGTLALGRLPTWVVLIGPEGEPGRRLAQALRETTTPVITRVVNDRVGLDVRTIMEAEVSVITRCLGEAKGRVAVV